MSLADVTSARSSPTPENCPECDATASVTSDLHKYQEACTCKPGSAQYACADDPGPPPPVKTDTPPALPPRPPTSVLASRRNNASVGCNADTSCRRRKYAWWCCGCGALAAALGGLLAAQHILVRAYTASPHHLETVPAAVPAAMLVLTGVCIMSLARRRNRYSYMIKVVGACCLICALTCVLVTITTTVIHMNKLQTLKFCEYTKLTRTCTCFSMPPDTQHNAGDDEGVRCVFEGVSECGVVHGALYWCLRGVFALSVSAVLVCIFSCMLAYQLLSHERKKMYWEQLELRCRSLYRPPSGNAGVTAAGRPIQNTCSCGAQCYPRQPAWDISLQHRFWAPGRIGNLYSPNPGTGRKASAWSWFPWPRSNSQNSRCQMGGVPQSGDSAYGFCDDTPSSNPQASYDDRTYPPDFRQNFPANFTPTGNFSPGQMINQAQGFIPQGNFTSSQVSFAPGQGNFAPVQGGFAPGQGNFGQYQEGFGESSGSFDAQTGVWGPPPPYSPQGRSGSRHHLHQQDPAAATLLHHHHIEVHRNSVHDHIDDHQHAHDHQHNHPHTCRNSYLHHLPPPSLERADGRVIQSISGISPDVGRMNQDGGVNPDGRTNPDGRMNPDGRLNQEMSRINQELRMNPDLRDRMSQDSRINQEMSRINPEMSRINPEMSRINPEMSRMNSEMSRINPEMSRLHSEMSRMNPELSCMNPDRLEMVHMSQMYPEDMEMTHIQDGRFNTLRGHLVPYRCQRMDMSASNLHRDCRIDEGVTNECSHQKSASKVSDQSSDSCKQGKENLGFQNDKHSPMRSSMQDCRVVNQNTESEVYFADVSSCCNVSVKAECCLNPNVSLVGTIENHPESTSESDTGSFTLTRQQRPQPQVGSKRRPNKHKTEKIRQNVNPQEKLRQNLNNSLRLTEHQIEKLNLRMNERSDIRMSDRSDVRMSERIDSRDRLNDSIRERGLNDSIRESRDRLSDSIRESRVDSRDRLSDSRNELDRINDSRVCDRMNDTRLSERMCERVCDRINDGRLERMNDSRISERLNDPRLDRLNDSRLERTNDPRIERMNDSRICDRMNEARLCERMIDPRLNDSRITRINDSCDRMNDSRDRNDSRHERMNDSRISDRIERMTDLNSSIRIEDSPKIKTHISPLRIPMPRTSPKNLSKDHPRQSSLDSNKPDFFVPPPPIISPLSPNTEESLLSDDDRPQDTVYSNDPESSKCLGPDSQYEPEKSEILKTNHHHCYSDTNTMDSGWQSGSEKQVTD